MTPQTSKSYAGWTISTGFLSGNLFNALPSDQALKINERDSCAGYARLCREAIEREFPGAEVSVDYQLGAEGSLPAPLQTTIRNPEGLDEDDLIDVVDDCCAAIFCDCWGLWVVEEPAE